MATLPPRDNTPRQHRSLRRWWIAFTAILVLAAVLWLTDVGGFRQTQTAPPPTVPVCVSTPSAGLNTAADYMARGDSDYDLGDYACAIADYSRAIELKPDFAEAYNNRAYTYMKMENYAPALPDLDEAIRLRPDYVNALMNRGDIYNYYYQIDYDRAIADYDRVIQLHAEHTSVCGHRLLALHHGWDLGVFGALLTSGGAAGCTVASPDD
jgi:tetratricopeptide (TPR) repeat protein